MRKSKNFLIGILCVVVALMAVGYATFSSLLNISGTATFSNNWKVEITGIRGVNNNLVPNNQAYDASAPTYTATTATFNTGLVSPGDERIYEVEVTNKGNIDADIYKQLITTEPNEAIIITYDGVAPTGSTGTNILTPTGTYNKTSLSETEPFGLPAITNNIRYIYITVKYSGSVQSQPDSLTTAVTLKLSAVEEGKENLAFGQTAYEKLTSSSNIVTQNSGLYNNGNGTYTYKGANPNNYMYFAGTTWRILSIDSSKFKLIREEKLDEDMAYDTRGTRDSRSGGVGGTYCEQTAYACNAWAATSNMVGSPQAFSNGAKTGTVLLDSPLKTYLNVDYYRDDLLQNSNLIEGPFDIGPTDDEASFKWIGKIGLLSVGEYIAANSNQVQCGTEALNNTNYNTCSTTNYLVKSNYIWWLINPYPGDTFNATRINSYGATYQNNPFTFSGVRPVIYLPSSLELDGTGTNDSNIYRIKQWDKSLLFTSKILYNEQKKVLHERRNPKRN